MKKSILLFSSLLAATALWAQTAPAVGIRAGLTSARIQGDAAGSLNSLIDYTGGLLTTGSRTGLYAGVYTSVPLGATFSLEPGISYSGKGYEMRGDFNIKGADFLGASAKARLNAHYIDVPVVLKADLGGFEVFAGPQVSYLARADVRTTAGVLGFNLLNRSYDVTENLNRWDAAVTGGAGYRFPSGLGLSLSYDHGLSRLDAGRNYEAYNRAFKAGLSYRF